MTFIDAAMVALSLALGFFLGLVYAYDHWVLPLERGLIAAKENVDEALEITRKIIDAADKHRSDSGS